MNEAHEGGDRLLAAQGDAAEALELVEEALNLMTLLVEAPVDGGLGGSAGIGLDVGSSAETVGLSSPLRVERARAVLLAPVSFDLVSGALTTRTIATDLTPDTRELDLELGWATALSRTASLRFGVAHAFDAGHVAGASDTAGFVTIAIR